MDFIKKNPALVAVVTVAVLMLLPFLGLADFNTKGEPREAVVALSMLKEGNWILPVNNGGDIPYKPPFFHFCIALLSLLSGSVSEYTSRLPSALALVAMTTGCFAFFKRRKSATVALVAAVLTLTSFEVHRAGTNCRVDMLLTAFTVGALLLLYRWWERGAKGLPVCAVLCMSGAVLTKGPVGAVVPCFVMGVFMLLRGGKLWHTIWRMALLGVLSLLLPAVWYVAAWHEGGQHFLDLVYEENIGRMTGSMTYESHEHGFGYNFFTLIVGWAPWTLLTIFSLFSLRKKRLTAAAEQSAGGKLSLKDRACRFMKWLATMKPVELFTWLSFLLVLFFYCLPSSKRSVYLLPCYPFMAVLIAEYVDWLWRTRRRAPLRVFTVMMAVLSVVLTAVFVAVRLGAVPDSIFHGKHAAENIAMLHALRFTPLNVWTLLLVALPAVNAIDVLRMTLAKSWQNYSRRMYYYLLSPVVLLFIALDGVYQPLVLNTKSLRPMAAYIAHTFPSEPLYSYINAPMMHFFGADFYLGDTIGQFENGSQGAAGLRDTAATPEHGVLIIPEGDFPDFQRRHTDYRFTLVSTSKGRISEVKDNVSFYRFRRVK